MSSPLIVQLDMAQFCEATELPAVYVIEIVEHGILEPQGSQPRDWRFTDYELVLAKRAAKLAEAALDALDPGAPPAVVAHAITAL